MSSESKPKQYVLFSEKYNYMETITFKILILLDNALKFKIYKNNIVLENIKLTYNEYMFLKEILHKLLEDFSDYENILDFNKNRINDIIENKEIISPNVLPFTNKIKKITQNDLETIYSLKKIDQSYTFQNHIIANHPSNDMIIPLIGLMNPIDNRINKTNIKMLSNLLILPEEYYNLWKYKLDKFYKYKYIVLNDFSNLKYDKTKLRTLKETELLIIILNNEHSYLNCNLNDFKFLIDNNKVVVKRIFYYYCELNGLNNNICLAKLNFRAKHKYHRVFNYIYNRKTFFDFYYNIGISLEPIKFSVTTENYPTVDNNISNSVSFIPLNSSLKIIESTTTTQEMTFQIYNMTKQLNYIDYFIYKEIKEYIETTPKYLFNPEKNTGVLINDIKYLKDYFRQLYTIDRIEDHNLIGELESFKVNTKVPHYLSILENIFTPEIFQLLEEDNINEFIKRTEINYDSSKNIINNILVDLYNKKLEDGDIKQKITCIQERMSKNYECVICIDTMHKPAVLNCCQNTCCLSCILQSYKTKNVCPFCRDQTNYRDNITILNDDNQISVSNELNISDTELINFNPLLIIERCNSYPKFKAIHYLIEQLFNFHTNAKVFIFIDSTYIINQYNNRRFDYDEIVYYLSSKELRMNVNSTDNFNHNGNKVYLIPKKHRSNIYSYSNNIKKNQHYNGRVYDTTFHFSYNFKSFDFNGCTDIIIPHRESSNIINNIKLFAESLNQKNKIRIWYINCSLENE